jgi:type I restriction enzyme S subunit
MQHLFPEDGETRPRVRFPEFQDAPEWMPHKIGDFVVKSFYGTSASTEETGKYPVLRMGNMRDGRLDLTNLVFIDLDAEDFESLRLERGDILLNRTNSRDLVGKISIFDHDLECITASYIVVFRMDNDRIDPWFCNVMLNTKMYQSRISRLVTPSISQANINPTRFRVDLDITVPQLDEQQRLSEFFCSFDDVLAAQSRCVEALQAHKYGLLKRLFPGLEEESL